MPSQAGISTDVLKQDLVRGQQSDKSRIWDFLDNSRPGCIANKIITEKQNKKGVCVCVGREGGGVCYIQIKGE